MKSILDHFPVDTGLMPNRTAQIVVVSGSWYEMGRQYVQQCKDQYFIRAAQAYGEYLEIFKDKKRVDELVGGYIEAAKNDTPQVYDLFRGMADESGLDIAVGAIIIYGKSMIRVELERIQNETCSTTAVWGESSLNGHLIGAANVDMDTNTTNYLPAVLAFPEDGNAYICGENFHRDGLNEKGLMMLLSGGQNAGKDGAIGGSDRHMWNDANILSFAYADNVEDAKSIYSKYKYVVGCNQLMADITQDACVIEFTASRFIIRRPGDYGEKQYLITCNGYLAPELQDNLAKGKMYWEFCNTRYWTLDKILRETAGSITIDTLREAHSLYRYYIPEGWSYDEKAGDDRMWRHDDSCPFEPGWHDHDPNIMHGSWSPQMRGFNSAASRFLIDADERRFCMMRGESNNLFSNTPGSVTTFWDITLGGGKIDVVRRAGLNLDTQIHRASYDLYEKKQSSPIREKYLEKARRQQFVGINELSLALCCIGYSDVKEMNYYLGKAISAFCEGQCLARMAQDRPNKMFTE